jgi:hypothetical protein
MLINNKKSREIISAGILAVRGWGKSDQAVAD